MELGLNLNEIQRTPIRGQKNAHFPPALGNLSAGGFPVQSVDGLTDGDRQTATVTSWRVCVGGFAAMVKRGSNVRAGFYIESRYLSISVSGQCELRVGRWETRDARRETGGTLRRLRRARGGRRGRPAPGSRATRRRRTQMTASR